MKKNLILILIALSMILSTNAQMSSSGTNRSSNNNHNTNEVFNKGDMMFNIGLGLPRYGGIVPSLNASGEFGAIPTGDVGIVSFGGEAEYKLSTYVGWSTHTYHQLSFGGRAAWHAHFFNNPKYDLYAGFGLGFRTWNTYSTSWNAVEGWHDKPETHASIYVSEFIGARLMTSDNFGWFAELGYGGISFARIGMTIKM